MNLRVVRLRLPHILAGCMILPHVLAAAEVARPSQGDRRPAGEGVAFPQYPHERLEAGSMRAWFYSPDARSGYYRGTRFDWSGLISRVQAKGHSFFCEFNAASHDPLNHDDVPGTAEELSMTMPPPNFAEAAPGDPFVKIGIGLLDKTEDKEYGFWKSYPVRKAADWKTVRKPGEVEFSQTIEGPNGWACYYTKTIRLVPDASQLVIHRRLKNIGTKTIDTDHYGHNFLQIDGVPAGPDYALDFPFTPRLGADSRPQGCVEVKGKSLVFLKAMPEGQALWVRLEGFDATAAHNRVTIRNTRTGGKLSISTDQPLLRFAFYSNRGVLSPEPFVSVKAAPGETREWSTIYGFE